jgi:hypothetical protein
MRLCWCGHHVSSLRWLFGMLTTMLLTVFVEYLKEGQDDITSSPPARPTQLRGHSWTRELQATGIALPVPAQESVRTWPHLQHMCKEPGAMWCYAFRPTVFPVPGKSPRRTPDLWQATSRRTRAASSLICSTAPGQHQSKALSFQSMFTTHRPPGDVPVLPFPANTRTAETHGLPWA